MYIYNYYVQILYVRPIIQDYMPYSWSGIEPTRWLFRIDELPCCYWKTYCKLLCWWQRFFSYSISNLIFIF